MIGWLYFIWLEYSLKFKDETQLKNRERIDNTEAEHEAKFPCLANDEGDKETVGLEENELENCGGGENIDHILQNSETKSLGIWGGLAQ